MLVAANMQSQEAYLGMEITSKIKKIDFIFTCYSYAIQSPQFSFVCPLLQDFEN